MVKTGHEEPVKGQQEYDKVWTLSWSLSTLSYNSYEKSRWLGERSAMMITASR